MKNEERYEKRYKNSITEIARINQLPAPFIYLIRTMCDSAVCDFCNSLKDKKFNLSEAVVGVNYPPFKNCTCDYCRCYAAHDLNI